MLPMHLDGVGLSRRAHRALAHSPDSGSDAERSGQVGDSPRVARLRWRGSAAGPMAPIGRAASPVPRVPSGARARATKGATRTAATPARSATTSYATGRLECEGRSSGELSAATILAGESCSTVTGKPQRRR